MEVNEHGSKNQIKKNGTEESSGHSAGDKPGYSDRRRTGHVKCHALRIIAQIIGYGIKASGIMNAMQAIMRNR